MNESYRETVESKLTPVTFDGKDFYSKEDVMRLLESMPQLAAKEIFVLAMFKRYKRSEEHPTLGIEPVAWYKTLEEAIENLHLNAAYFCDYEAGCRPYNPYALIEKRTAANLRPTPGEHTFPFALVERVPEGPEGCGLLGDYDADVHFFEWKDNAEHTGGDYVPMERPKEFSGMISFTIG